MSSPHRFANVFNAVLTAAALFVAGAAVDRAIAADEEEPFIGVVTAANVYVRSGPADSYYPIGRVREGDLVKVVGERFNWARIHAVGPTFAVDEEDIDKATFFGYIIYPKTQPGRFRIERDGKTGRTLGRTDVLAPNLNSRFDPNDSWKPLVRLDADHVLRVIETLESANNFVQKVVLPDEAEVWVSMNYIRRANEQELAAWERYFGSRLPDGQASAEEETQLTEAKTVEAKTVEAKTDDRSAARAREQKDVAAESPRASDGAETTEVAASPREEEPARTTPLAREEQTAPRVEPQPRETTPRQIDEKSRSARDESDADDVAPEPRTPTQTQPDRTAQVADPPWRETAPSESEDSPDTVVMGGEKKADVAADEEPAGEPTPTLAEQLADATLDDLEAAFEQLRREPIETAEVAPLRQMYLEFAANRAETDNERHIAEGRAEQLELWAELQRNRQQLARLRSRAELTGERTRAARAAIDDAGDYTAVGRLAVSTIYDGRRLPRLLRVQDPGTGRTVAYVQPEAEFDLTPMIGQLIGVIGEKEYDGGLRLNLIRPRRVDILAPQRDE